MKPFEKFQALMTAAAFAEENEHAAAREIAGEVLVARPTAPETCATIAGTFAVEHGK